MTKDGTPVDLTGVEKLVGTVDALVREALAVASKRTDGGKGIDDEQVHCERLAYAATEARAARDLLTYAARRSPCTRPIRRSRRWRPLFAGEVARKLRGQIEAHLDDFGIGDERLERHARLAGAAGADPRRDVGYGGERHRPPRHGAARRQQLLARATRWRR